MADTSVHIGSLTLKNPVTVASGTAGYGEELAKLFDISRLGAVFTKGLSVKPRPGNSGPRIVETTAGVLNSIGLENVGVEKFLDEKLPFLKKAGATVIANVAGHSVEENLELCETLSKAEGVQAVELNVSCPNVKEGGIAFGRDLGVFSDLVERARNVTSCPLIVKLSPNVTDVTVFAKAAENLGADAVSAVNTFLGMKIDLGTRRPHFINRVAGYSGPAIKPMALRIVYEIYREVTIPVIGLGGICSFEDALEFIFAGAHAVSIGTMSMVDPMVSVRCVEKLEGYMKSEKIPSLADIVGCAHRA